MIDTQRPIDRLPPQNPEAEEAVLGSCLMAREAIDQVRGDLDPADFYREKNGAIYGCMLALSSRGEPVDFLTLTDELARLGRYDEVGGLSYLSYLIGVVPTAVHVEHYAAIVKRTALARRLISAAGKIAGIAYDDSVDAERKLTLAVELLADVQRGVPALNVASPEDQMLMLSDLADDLQRGKPPGIPTGLYLLDDLTGGLRRGSLVVIGAPTGVGKTSLMQSIARTVRRAGRRVLFASSEMTTLEVVKRNAAAWMKRDWNSIESDLCRKEPPRETIEALGSAIHAMPRLAFSVYHEGRMTTDKVRRRSAKLQADGGLDVVFVDYLQRLADSDRSASNRSEQVTMIARALKSMAVDLDVPVVVAAQFSRACTYRPDKEPVLSDFRESGGIEQEADVALGIYRESYFSDVRLGKDGKPLEEYGQPVPVDPSEAWLHVLKNRHGRDNQQIMLRWLAETCEYGNPIGADGRPAGRG